MTTFTDAVAVVTGGANGIGRACALAFAKRGADIVVVDIDASGAEAVAKEIEALGRKAIAVPTDVGDQLSVEQMCDVALEWQGRIDVFLNNAGIAVGGPPHLIPVADWDAAMRVNLWASIWTARKIIPHMLERGSGSFAAMSSPAGLRGVPMLGPYCVSKFALNGFLECLAIYCYGKGVSVQVVMPGPPLATTIVKNARVTYEDDDLVESEAREAAHRTWSMIAQPPDDLAEKTADGIESGSFYIFHSPDTPVTSAERFGDLDGWLKQMSHDFENASFGHDPLVTSSKTKATLG